MKLLKKTTAESCHSKNIEMVLMLLIHIDNMHGLSFEKFHCDDQKKMRFAPAWFCQSGLVVSLPFNPAALGQRPEDEFSSLIVAEDEQGERNGR